MTPSERIRFLPVPAVVAVAVLAFAVPPVSAQFSLDAMTFNIRTSIGRDGDNSWPQRKELVAETIRRYGPHVLGLQEALEDQLDYLEAELDGYRWLGVDRGLNGGTGLSEYTPIFYRHAELSPIESGTFWLTDTPESPTPGRRVSRIVTWARFYHIETGQQVYVFNTHLTLRRGPRQVDSVRRIADRIAELPEDSVVLLLGDFNAVAEVSDTWRAATEHGLDDAWTLAQARGGPPVTSSGFRPPRAGVEDRIDWILVGGPLDVRWIETVLYNEEGRYPSDHYPVFARLEIGVE